MANYWKLYPFDRTAAQRSRPILTILYEVYGYAGAIKLETVTE